MVFILHKCVSFLNDYICKILCFYLSHCIRLLHSGPDQPKHVGDSIK